MAPSHLIIEVTERIGTVTLNRPDKLNALNDDVLAELAGTAEPPLADPTGARRITNGAGQGLRGGCRHRADGRSGPD